MYLDTKNDWDPPDGLPPPPPRLNPRQERVLLWLLAVNLLLLFVAPLAGVTIFEGLYALLVN